MDLPAILLSLKSYLNDQNFTIIVEDNNIFEYIKDNLSGIFVLTNVENENEIEGFDGIKIQYNK